MTAEEYIKQIMDLQDTDLVKALELCKEGIANYPKEAKLYYLKALTLWNQSEVFNVPRQEFSYLIKQATDLDPHYSEPHKLWAYANELLGYPQQALEGYIRALEANPEDVEALGKQAELTRQLGDPAKALELFDKLLTMLKEPTDRAYNFRGHTKLDLKDYQGAIEDFTKALEINPKVGGALWGRGLSRKELGDYDGAIKDFTEMIALYPKEVYGYEGRAESYKKKGDLINALKDFQQALFLAPHDDKHITPIIELQKQLMAKVPEGTEVLCTTLKSGHKAKTVPIDGEMITFLDLNNDTEEKTKKGLNEAGGENPDTNSIDRSDDDILTNAEKYIKQITDLQKLDLDRAMDLCNEGIANYPRDARLYYFKAVTLWNKSKIIDLPTEEFTSLLKQATDLDPHYSKPHKLWAYANEVLGHKDLALLGYTRAFEADPKDVDALGKKAELTRDIGKPAEALELFNQLFPMLNNPSDRAYNERGFTKVDLKDFRGAIADFTEALKINPELISALGCRGACKEELGDLKGAEEDFTQVISIRPDKTLAYEERARIYLKQARFLMALKDLQQVLFLDVHKDDVIPVILDLQNMLWSKIPNGTDVLHTTLKSGYKAKVVNVGGEVITFLELDTVDESYENIAQAMTRSLEGQEWQTAVLKILMDRYPEAIGYELTSYDAEDKPQTVEMKHFPDKKKVEQIYLLFKEGQSDWDKIEFVLKKDGTFSIDFKCEEPELFNLAKNEEWDEVKELLNSGSTPFVKSSDGRTFAEFILQGDSPKDVKDMIYDKMSEYVMAGTGGKTVKFGIRQEAPKRPGAEEVIISPEEAFFRAISVGDINSVKVLLSRGDIDINAIGHFHETALMSAVGKNNTEIVKLLIEAGADTNHINAFKKTILMEAVSKGNIDIVKLLIDGGADIDYANKIEGTALMIATKQNQPEIMKVLIASGANVNYKNNFGDTILTEAVSKGKIDPVKVLVANGADVNYEKSKESVLCIAVKSKNKNAEVVKTLIDGGANVNFKDVFRRTILEIAETFNVEKDDATDKRNRAEIVALLKAAGAVNEREQKADPYASLTAEQINTPERLGLTRLAIAVRGGKPEEVKALIAKGADVNWAGTFNESVLMMALKDNKLEIAQILIDAGANINHVDSSKNSALMAAVKKNKVEIIKFLLSAKADVNCVNKANETPLLVAVQTNKAEIAKMLIAAGADINYKNSFGRTILYVAQNRHLSEMVEILKAAGAN